jgi:hypothetical protein
MRPTFRGLLSLSLMVAPQLGAAQAPPQNSAPVAAPTQAEALIAEGVALRTQQRDAEALTRFEEANRLAPSARALAQIALAEQALNRWVMAERHMREALAATTDPWIVRNTGPLRSALTVIDSHLGRLEVRTNVAGAELWVSAVREGTLPLAAPLRVVVGAVPIELRALGYQTATRTVTITPGQLVSETITLAPDAQTTGPMGGPVDFNEQTRARTILIAGLGAGLSFFVPVVGVGVRYGFFQNRFEIQGRVDLSLDWSPFSSTFVSYTDEMGLMRSEQRTLHFLGPVVGADGTFRVRPISNRSIWYVGLGVMGRFGVRFPAVALPPNSTTTQPVGPNIAWALGIAIETGFLLGERSNWDLSIRFLGGAGALNGVVTLGYAL